MRPSVNTINERKKEGNLSEKMLKEMPAFKWIKKIFKKLTKKYDEEIYKR